MHTYEICAAQDGATTTLTTPTTTAALMFCVHTKRSRRRKHALTGDSFLYLHIVCVCVFICMCVWKRKREVLQEQENGQWTHGIMLI